MIETTAENEVYLCNVIHPKDDIPDIVDFHTNLNVQNDTQNYELLPIHTKTILQMHCTHNKMLNHYNCTAVGCFKEIFQDCEH